MSRERTPQKLITGGLVLGEVGSADYVDLVIEGGTIAARVAPGEGPEDAERIDARNAAIMPGLINGHVHGHGTLSKGRVADRWPLELFLNALPWLGSNRNAEDMYINGLLGAVEMIRKGSTACFDMFFEYPKPSREGIFAVGQAYYDAGIRATLAPMIADRTLYQAYPAITQAMSATVRDQALSMRMAPGEQSVAAAADVFRKWALPRDRVRPGLGPTIPLHCSDAFLVQCDRLARDFDLPVQTHLAETRAQAVTGMRAYGKSLTAHLDELGLLGPHFTAAHAIWLDDDDMQRLADAGASAVHVPASNLRFGSGLARVGRMRDKGINIGLATDAANSSDSLNMFEAMRLGASVSNVVTADFRRWLGVPEVLAMATHGSARCMGFGEQIGRIEPGYRADLVFLDLDHINYVPLGDLARQIVFTENAAAVDCVMIDGRLVLEHGRITTLDEAKLRRDARAAAERLYAASAPLRDLARRFQPAVEAFCLDMADQPYHVERLARERTPPEPLKH